MVVPAGCDQQFSPGSRALEAVPVIRMVKRSPFWAPFPWICQTGSSFCREQRLGSLKYHFKSSSLKNNDYNRFKKRGRIWFPAGRDSWGYIPLMEPNDRCCMQSVKGFLRPGFQALFIGQFVFKRVILAITRPIAGQEHEYPLKKPGLPRCSSPVIMIGMIGYCPIAQI